METEPVRLACFDLGGVIVRTCRNWREGCEAADVPYHAAADEPARRAAFAAVVRRYETGRMDDAAYRREGAAALGGVYNPEELGRIHDAWIRGEFPGVAEIMASLSARSGVVTGCLSNTNPRHWELMAGDACAYAAFHRMERRWSSHLLGVMKPDRAIYRTYAERAGIAPEAILFFDDLEENVSAARAAGWRAVTIDREGEIAAQIRAGLREHGIGI